METNTFAMFGHICICIKHIIYTRLHRAHHLYTIPYNTIPYTIPYTNNAIYRAVPPCTIPHLIVYHPYTVYHAIASIPYAVTLTSMYIYRITKHAIP